MVTHQAEVIRKAQMGIPLADTSNQDNVALYNQERSKTVAEVQRKATNNIPLTNQTSSANNNLYNKVRNLVQPITNIQSNTQSNTNEKTTTDLGLEIGSTVDNPINLETADSKKLSSGSMASSNNFAPDNLDKYMYIIIGFSVVVFFANLIKGFTRRK